jgi:sodium-dependent dicarboxylate transporter 2/3/5
MPKTRAATRLMKGFCLSIAYSASIGGAGSLVGTTPNLILKGYFDDNYKQGGLNFISYMAFAAPVSFLMIFISWIVMCLLWIPYRELFTFKRKDKSARKSKKDDPLYQIISQRYDDLGPYT